MPRQKNWRKVQAQKIVMARQKLKKDTLAKSDSDMAKYSTSSSSTNGSPVILQPPESPVILQAPESPVILQAPESPVILQAPESPVILQAPRSPVILQAPRSPVILQAPGSPVILQANAIVTNFSTDEDNITNEQSNKNHDTESGLKINVKDKSFPKDSCIEVYSNAQGLNMEPSHQRMFIFGAFNQADKRFSIESRGSQCTTNALCALIYANFSYLYDAQSLDDILIDGDRIYRITIACLKANNTFKGKLLCFEELPNQVMLLNKKMKIMKSDVISGHFIQQYGDSDFPSMHQSLHTALQKSSYLLFMIGAVCSAVFKKDDKIYFFDSHSHNVDGFSAEDGNSLLASFCSLEDLVSFMYALYTSMNIDMNSQFDLLPLNFMEISDEDLFSMLKDSCNSSDKLNAIRKNSDKSWTEVSHKIQENKQSLSKSISYFEENEINEFPSETLISGYFKDQLERRESFKLKNAQDCKRKTYLQLYKWKQRQSNIFRKKERQMSLSSKRKARECEDFKEKEKCIKRSYRQTKENTEKERLATLKSKKKARLSADFQEKEKCIKRSYRQTEENTEKERVRTLKSMKKARLSADFQEKEKCIKRSYRQTEENTEKERLVTLKSKKKARLSADFQEKEKCIKRSYRQTEENTEKERVRTLKSMNKARLSADFQEKEKCIKRSYRQTEENTEKERVRTLKSMKKARLSADFQEKEKCIKRSYRQTEENTEKERLVTLKSKKKARLSADFQEKEKCIKRSYRQTEENTEKERVRTLKSMNKARECHEYKIKECKMQRESKRKARSLSETLEKERLVKKARRSDAAKRQNERQSDKNKNAKKRKDSSFHEGEISASKKRKYGSSISECIDIFHKTISVGPVYVCSSCHQTWFRQNVSEVKNLSDHLQNKYLTYLKSIDGKQWICSTCKESISNDKIPRLSVANGMKWPLIPKELELFPLEERLVSLLIPFMQIRELPRGRQLSVKGNVINVPVDIQPVVNALPRAFDENISVPVKLKKRLSHKSYLFSENVRPLKVLVALHWLMKHSVLYQNSNIKIDENWVNEVTDNSLETVREFFCEKNCSSSETDFSKDDEHDLNTCTSNQFIKQDKAVTEPIVEALYDSDDDEITTENVGNIDTMLEDANLQNRNDTFTFAPGEGQQPLSIYQDKDSEYLCFPSIFCGQRRKENEERLVPIHYSDIAKWELRSQDRRAANSVPNIFFKLKKIQMKQLNDKVNLAVRRCQPGKKIMTVGETRNSETINDIVKKDEGYFLFKQIRNSPSYLETKKKDVFAMIRQLGLPTWFMSLSSADTRWIDLLKMLASLNKKLNIDEDQIHSLTWEEKTKLIQSDPVTCSRYFDHRVREFINTVLNSEHNPLGELIDYFYRVEFQQRGSPHIHMIVWIKDSPKIQTNSCEEIAQFVDKYLQCSHFDVDLDILTDLQVHKHSRTCRKKKDRLCRFGYPLPPLPKTMILEPLEDEKEKYKQLYQDIQKRMNEEKEGYDMSYETFLKSVIMMTEDDYIKCIRSSLNTSKVFLKRNPSDIRVNLYNKDILKAWKANIDIQFVLDPYACAMYIVSYISKSQRGMSNLLHAAAKEARSGNLDIKKQVRHIGNVFSNSVEVSAQEAVYLVLQMSLAKSTRDVVFINTSQMGDRVQLLKPKSVLDEMPADSTDIMADSNIKRYSKRPKVLEKYCLADYVSQLDIVYPDKDSQISKEQEINDDEENAGDYNDQPYFGDGDVILTLKNGIKIKRRSKPKVIRYVRFNKKADEENFYREKLLLFLPWRNEESDILGKYATYREHYEAQKQDVDLKCALYEHHVEELELAKQAAEADNDVYDDFAPSAQEMEAKSAEEEVLDSEIFIHFNPDRATEHRHYDIGIEIGCTVSAHQVECNSTILPDNLYRELLCSLNTKQTQFYNHVIHWIKTKDTPLYAFLTGGAGVGKSVVIRALYQTLYRHLNLKEGEKADETRVLLCAYTGKAAFNINGSTISSAFRQKYKQSNQNLTCDSLNSFRSKFRSLSVVIIDEVSMVGNSLLNFIDQRLQELKGTRIPFGGVSIIAVGDLYQLKPVNSDWIFNDLKKDASSLANNLWKDHFTMFELTEVMRQKDDLDFAELLNRLRKNELNPEDRLKLEECSIKQKSENYMINAPHLFAENYYMHLFNDTIINSMKTDKVVIPCHDTVIAPQLSKEKQADAVRKLPNDPNITANLHSSLVIVVDMIYDLTVNINTEDGLANGASCIVRYIEYKQIETQRPSIIWVQFDEEKAGMETRIQFKNRQFYHSHIDENWTPIFDIERSFIYNRKTFQRIQFPLQPSAGRSVHRAQGSTLERVVVDLSQRKTRKVPHLHYVALSRVRSQKNLQILNFNEQALKVDDQVKNEMDRLQQQAQLQLSYVPVESINSCIKITFNNCRSLHLHHKDIKQNFGLNSAHVITLAETRLHDSDSDAQYALNGFRLFRNDQKTGYTCARPPHGLAIYVKDGIQMKTYFSFTSKQLEFTIACLSFPANEIQLVVLYKAPNMACASFVKMVENKLVPHLDTTMSLIIMGDFNLDINDKHKNTVKKLGEIFSCQMLMNEPTTDNNATLDLIFSNRNMRTGTVESYWSDHKIIFAYMEKENDKLLTQSGNGQRYSGGAGGSLGGGSSSNTLNTNTDASRKTSKDKYLQKIPEEEPPQADCKRKILKVVVTVLFIVIVVGVVVIWSLHEGRSRKHVGNHYFDFVSTKRVLNVYNKKDNVILAGYLKISDFDVGKVKKCEDIEYEDNFCFKFLDGTHFTFHPYSLPNSDVKCVDLLWENLKSFHDVPIDCYDIEYGLWFGLPNFKGPFWPLNRDKTSIDFIPYRPFHDKILGHVLENYWISTEGVAIIAHQNLPLKVSFNSGNDKRLCLTLDVKGMNMKALPAVNYTVCQGKDIKDVFQHTRSVYFPPTGLSGYKTHDFSKLVWSYEDKYHNNKNHFGQFLHDLKTAELPISMVAYNSDWEKNQGDIKIQQSVFNEFKQYLEGKYSDTKLMLPINVACSYLSDNFNRGVKERLFVKDPETGSFQTIRYNDQSCALWDASNPRTKYFLQEAFDSLQQKETMEETEFPHALEFRTTIGDSVYPLLLYINTSDVNKMNVEFLNVLLNLNKSILMQTAFRMQNKPVFVEIPTKIANRNNKKCLDYILSGALTAGLHGYPFIMAEPPPEDKIDHEFSIRWIELAMFFPGIKITNSAINFGDDVKNVTKQLIEFRTSVIMPHIYNAINDIKSGVPIIRPLWWADPADYTTLTISDQFLIGETLLVAPILCHGDRKRDIYVPSGAWTNVKTGQTVHGGQWLRNVEVPLHEVPSFISNRFLKVPGSADNSTAGYGISD